MGNELSRDLPETPRGFTDDLGRRSHALLFSLQVSLKGVQEESIVGYREPVIQRDVR